jgi:hypothetical protein
MAFLKLTQGSEKGKRLSERHAACENLCLHLRLEGVCHSDDDLDAIICALTAVAPSEALVSARELLDEGELPSGFRILKENPFRNIVLKQCDFSAWIADMRLKTAASTA